MIILWAAIFIVSLIIMVKSADYFLQSAEKIGLAVGLSPFIVGVTIVGMGTSFPELISSIIAVLKNVTEIVPANVIGSNIANILLIVGLSAIAGKCLIVTKSLIDLDLPLIAIATVILMGVVWDKQVTFGESLLLVVSYTVYFLYTVFHKDDSDSQEFKEVLPSRINRRKHITRVKNIKIAKPKLGIRDFVWLIVGITGLILGSKYLIDAVVEISDIFSISPAIISITAVAIGTSLPELMVSIRAAFKGKSEIAIGNIFGSNIFNALIVLGLPGLFKNLTVDENTFTLGVPTMALATLLFVISGISRRIHLWEGAMYVMLYALFIGKLFNLF